MDVSFSPVTAGITNLSQRPQSIDVLLSKTSLKHITKTIGISPTRARQTGWLVNFNNLLQRNEQAVGGFYPYIKSSMASRSLVFFLSIINEKRDELTRQESLSCLTSNKFYRVLFLDIQRGERKYNYKPWSASFGWPDYCIQPGFGPSNCGNFNGIKRVASVAKYPTNR